MDCALDLRLALLNPWQRDFPLVPRPYAMVADALGLAEPAVRAGYAALLRDGALSRIGAVFAPGAGGASLLAAIAVPPDRLDDVAARVSAEPGVNHNYAREDRVNLWFVMTGASEAAVEQALLGLEAATGLPVLRLPMRRPYRLDLGFDLSPGATSSSAHAATRRRPPRADIAPLDTPGRRLAALVEDGLPLDERPYAVWADALGWSEDRVRSLLRGWIDDGTVRRFGTIVRHHELGWSANAMTVFDVPDEAVDPCGAALAREPGVTLAYRRDRAAGWPYNLYCMVHGTDRDAVRRVLDRALPRCGLAGHPHRVLFSTRRYKQTGARRFRPVGPVEGGAHAAS